MTNSELLKPKVGLLITGCVTPPENVYYLNVKDPEERRNQYVESLGFFIERSGFDKLVYCDNSSESPDERLLNLAVAHNKELEWISFRGDEEKCIDQGKGYGEGEIIEYALKNSRLLKACDYFAKITGRIKLHNIDELVECTSSGKDFYFNLYKERDGSVYADTRFYISKIDSYSLKLGDLYMSVDDRIRRNIENLFGERLRSETQEWESLPQQPAFDGFSGSSGNRLSVGEYEQYDFEDMKKEIIDGKFYPYKWMYHEMHIVPDAKNSTHGLIKGKGVALYGAGKMGRFFYKSFTGWCRIEHWIDSQYDRIGSIYNKKLDPPDVIGGDDFTCIVIAVAEKRIVDEIIPGIQRYISSGNKSIIWFDGNTLTQID